MRIHLEKPAEDLHHGPKINPGNIQLQTNTQICYQTFFTVLLSLVMTRIETKHLLYPGCFYPGSGSALWSPPSRWLTSRWLTSVLLPLSFSFQAALLVPCFYISSYEVAAEKVGVFFHNSPFWPGFHEILTRCNVSSAVVWATHGVFLICLKV